MIRTASGVCDAEEACSGADANCPADAAMADNTPYDDDQICNEDKTCQSGVCATAQALDCDDNNLCTVDSCDSGTMLCANDEVIGCCLEDSDCNDNDPCTTDT